MPKTSVIRKGRTTVTIEAYAEVIAAPTAPLGKWSTVFRKRLEDNTRNFAPGNSRPRWSHYGPRLRSTFGGAIRYNPVAGRVDFAVGSSASHALYVDQGTGVYNGAAPWRARILPPWKRGQGSLYEASWIPPGNSRRVRPVWIKGQKGQHFMERGLERTMASMRMRSYQLPDDPRMAKAIATAPRSLTGFLSGTPNNGSFRAQLEQWREWRDKTWNSGRELGNTGARKNRRDVKKARDRYRSRRAQTDDRGPLTNDQRRWAEEAKALSEQRRKERRAANARRYRERVKSGQSRKPDRSLAQARSQEKARFRAHLEAKYGKRNVDNNIQMRDGKWQARVYMQVKMPNGRIRREWRTVEYTPKTTSKGRRRQSGW